jgi:predicted nucleotide-binding protein
MTKRIYRNTGIPARSLGLLRDYLQLKNSRSLGGNWGHKTWWYRLNYPGEVVDCKSFEDVKKVLAERGETVRHEAYFESQTGRKIWLDATQPAQIVLEVENRELTEAMLRRVEEIMGLTAFVRRVFVTHGKSSIWREVQAFLEKECNPPIQTMELASNPSKGATLIEKLDEYSANCSFAVVVMTGDDAAGEDGGELRARENVIHEIGFFQGRYGRGRVCLLYEEGTNIPNNLKGIGYCPFPKGLCFCRLD